MTKLISFQRTSPQNHPDDAIPANALHHGLLLAIPDVHSGTRISEFGDNLNCLSMWIVHWCFCTNNGSYWVPVHISCRLKHVHKYYFMLNSHFSSEPDCVIILTSNMYVHCV